MLVMTFIIALIFFLLTFIIMSIKYFVKHKEIQLNCSKLNSLGIENFCCCSQLYNSNSDHTCRKC